MASDSSPITAAPGLRGWTTQAKASRAVTPGIRGWVAQGLPTRAETPGFCGWVAQGLPTQTEANGLRGWAATIPTNLRLAIVLPPSQDPADTYVPLIVELFYAGTRRRVLSYPSGGRYMLAVPPSTVLTLRTTSPRYAPTSQDLTVLPGQIAEATILLALLPGQRPAYKVRRRYLKG